MLSIFQTHIYCDFHWKGLYGVESAHFDFCLGSQKETPLSTGRLKLPSDF